jgi:tetratricopeptide (TPR) repeat protein/tRNA A-37 threonylcarbamoyl transferase component Bud32
MANENSTKVGLPAGSKIGKYEVVERSGAGGQASVYKCYDRLLDRYVAIKQISTHLADDPKFLERFRREAQILAKLGAEQAAVVAIHELIEDERGLFIVMEYVPGHTLEATLADNPGPVEVKATLAILWRLAAGLHAVHQAGIVHRDIKPGNIIIAEGLRPKIADFGVAVSLTGQTSMLLGTTKYMAPELLGGSSIDGRADMYSLGFIAYEMLLGRQKFNEVFAEVVRDKHSESLRWMKWHGNEQVQAPRVCEINPQVPRELSDIVAKMIAKNPADRFESMEALGRFIKSSFSPRAKAAGAAQAPGQSRRRRRAKAPVAAGGDSGSYAPDAARDEADELEIGSQGPSLEGPATARLPKRRMSTRTKLVLAGAGAAAMIVFVCVMWGIHRTEANAQRDRAQQAYGKAQSLYEAQSFEQARDAFGQIVDARVGGYLAQSQPALLAQREALALRALNVMANGSPSDKNFAQQALAMLHMSLAQVAMGQSQWKEAEDQKQIATDLVKKMQATGGDYKWTQDTAAAIEDFGTSLDRWRLFAGTMDEINQHVAKKEYDEALGMLHDARKLPAAPREQARKMDELEKTIIVAKAKGKYDDKFAEAEKLAAGGQLNEAKNAYAEAKAIITDNRELLGAMSQAEMETLTGNVDKKVAELVRDADVNKLVQDIDKAHAAGKKQEELDLLKKLKQKKPSPQLDDRIATLDRDMILDVAKSLITKGNYDEAGAQIDKAQQVKDGPDIKILRDTLGKLKDNKALVAGATADFVSGRYEDALAKFQKAYEFNQDDDVKTKIVECRYQIEKVKADKLTEGGKYDEAKAAYDKLRAIKPSADAQINALIKTATETQKYKGYIEEGDKDLARQEYDKAIAAYKRAKQEKDIEEVKAKLDNASYQKLIYLGKGAVDGGDYSAAKAYFNQAKKVMDTPEVNALIKQMEDKVKSP